MVGRGHEAKVVSRLDEGAVKCRLALLSYQAQGSFEHAGWCLGGLGPLVVFPFLHLGLCGKRIDGKKLWSLLLELPGCHAARSWWVQDTTGARRADRQAPAENGVGGSSS